MKLWTALHTSSADYTRAVIAAAGFFAVLAATITALFLSLPFDDAMNATIAAVIVIGGAGWPTTYFLAVAANAAWLEERSNLISDYLKVEYDLTTLNPVLHRLASRDSFERRLPNPNFFDATATAVAPDGTVMFAGLTWLALENTPRRASAPLPAGFQPVTVRVARGPGERAPYDTDLRDASALRAEVPAQVKTLAA